MKKTDSFKVKEGDYLSEIQFYQVLKNEFGHIKLKNERGFEFSVDHHIAEEGMYSADQWTEEKVVTKTEMCELIASAWGGVFTCTFYKQLKSADLNKAIESLNSGVIKSRKEMKKIIKDTVKGELRILVGYLVKSETGLGRSICIDLEKDRGTNPKWDARLVQVDHRTIVSLIYQNVLYRVK